MFFGLMRHQILRNVLAESQHHERLSTVDAARRLPRPQAGVLARVAAFLGVGRPASFPAVVIGKPQGNSRRTIGVGS